MTDHTPLADQLALVDEIHAATTASDGGLVFELTGPRGSGRTVVLGALARRIGSEPVCLTLAADLANYVPSPLTATGDVPPKVALGEYETFLRDLASQANAREALTAAVSAPSSSARDDAVDVAVRADDLAIALVDALASKLDGRRLVLLVDNALALRGDLARWLRRLLDRLVLHEGAVAVLAMQATLGEDPEWPGRVVRRRIPAFTSADIAARLAERLGRPPAGDAVDAVARWSGGYPLAVEAAATMAVSAASTDELQRLLERPPSDMIAFMAPALEFLRTTTGAVRDAIEVAAVLRRFDEDAVRRVLTRLELAPPEDLGIVLRRLPLTTEPDEDAYAFHEFFRVLVERELEAKRPTDSDWSRFVAITRAAIGAYQDRLRDAAEDRDQVYAGWGRRLEPPEMQALLVEFLYHAARYPDRTYARRRFATIYFDVFWWWGWYLEEPFTTRLLDGWESSQRRYDESEFIGPFRRFQRSYVPAGRVWREGAGSPDQNADVVDALTLIRGRLLKLPTDGPDARQRHILAITAAFMGDALRRRDVRDPEADRCYREALEHFRNNAADARAHPAGQGEQRAEDDEWCVPWPLYLLADLACSRGRFGEARRLAHEALALAADEAIDEEDRDFEVIANCHRVLGDARIGEDPRAAFAAYVSAVIASYAFQAMPYPDAYTREFHREQTGRAMERLRELAATREHDALEICRSVAAWGLSGLQEPDPCELLRRRSWDELASVLFPREPRADELGGDSDYVHRVGRLRQDLVAQLLRPPPADEPPPLRRFWRRVRPTTDVAEAEPRPRSAFPGLPDVAVPLGRFAPEDDPAWPSWWRDDVSPVDWRAPGHDEPLPDELRRALESAIEDLPPRRRRVLELRDIEGLSAAAVCERLDISHSDQTVMLHRARSALRRALEPRLAEARQP